MRLLSFSRLPLPVKLVVLGLILTVLSSIFGVFAPAAKPSRYTAPPSTQRGILRSRLARVPGFRRYSGEGDTGLSSSTRAKEAHHFIGRLTQLENVGATLQRDERKRRVVIGTSAEKSDGTLLLSLLQTLSLVSSHRKTPHPVETVLHTPGLAKSLLAMDEFQALNVELFPIEGLLSSVEGYKWNNETKKEDEKEKIFMHGLRADLVILTNCDIDLPVYGSALLKLHAARPPDQKFSVACLAKDFSRGASGKGIDWVVEHLEDWAKEGGLRILMLSDHAAESMQNHFLMLADSIGTYMSGFEFVPVDIYVPFLQLQSFNTTPSVDPLPENRWIPTLPGSKKSRFSSSAGAKRSKPLSDAAIVGDFNLAKRDYTRVLDELEAVLKANPEIWGYKLAEDGSYKAVIPKQQTLPETLQGIPAIGRDSADGSIQKPILADTSNIPGISEAAPPFTLHLLGLGMASSKLAIPDTLKEIVKLHLGLNYTEFWTLMNQMDVMVPAWKDQGYYSDVSSIDVPIALSTHTPILFSPRHLALYPILTSSNKAIQPYILRPQSISEVEALKVLRSPSSTPLSQQASEVSRAWVDTNDDWIEVINPIRDLNEVTMRKVLEGRL